MKLNCKKYVSWFLMFGTFLMLLSCNEGDGYNNIKPSNFKAITAFSFPSLNGSVNGKIIGHNISVTVPYATNVTDLKATFITTGTSVEVNGIKQVSNVTENDFTNPVIYKVIAADGSTRDYIVIVTIAPKTAKSITAFWLDGFQATITGHNISVTVPYTTNVTDLKATFITSGTSVEVNGVKQVDGVTENNFTHLVVYKVIAADGSTRDYTVTVTIAPKTANAITEFWLDGSKATIIGHNILVTVPYATNVTDLKATFITSGTSVEVNGIKQVSNVTENNFTHPVLYKVIAADGSTRDYTVTVTIAPNTAKFITEFWLDGVQATIVANSISVTLPYATNLKALIATFITSGTSVEVNGVKQVSGVTENDFTNPVIYKVIAADGSARYYIVIVTAAAFTAYYPSGCTLNNAAAGEGGTCICIKDTLTGKIWTVSGNQVAIWTDWCNHVSGTTGYDSTCPSTLNSLDTWNGSAHCGLTGGWHLPTAQIATNDAPLSGNMPGGDWSDLYNIAISGSSAPGLPYIQYGDLSVWMNNNGFQSISNSTSCLGTTCPGNYWSALGYHHADGVAMDVQMNGGALGLYYKNSLFSVLLVH